MEIIIKGISRDKESDWNKMTQEFVGWCKLCGKAFTDWNEEITRHMIDYHNVFTYAPNEMESELVQD